VGFAFSRFLLAISRARRRNERSSRLSQAQDVRVKLHASGVSIATSMTLPWGALKFFKARALRVGNSERGATRGSLSPSQGARQ
jgi:hypothetical protein